MSQLLNSERVKAFGGDAKAVYSDLTDGQISFDDALAVGQLLIDGVLVAVDFIVAGITDVANALSAFFDNVTGFLGDIFNIGSSSW